MANILDGVTYWVAVDGVGDFSSENYNEILPIEVDGTVQTDAGLTQTLQIGTYGYQYLSIQKALEHPKVSKVFIPIRPAVPGLGLGDDGLVSAVLAELESGETVLGGGCQAIELSDALEVIHGAGLPSFAAAATLLTGPSLTEFAFPGSDEQ